MRVDPELADMLTAVTDEMERQLLARHPRLAAYLDMTIIARPLWGGGWDCIGTTYASEADAVEAKRAAIMHKLIAADRVEL